MQKMLIAANKFPDKDSLRLFTKKSEKVKTESIEVKRDLKRHIKEL